MTPYLRKPTVALSEQGKSYLQELTKSGIIKIDNRFRDVADYLSDELLDNVDNAKKNKTIVRDLIAGMKGRSQEMGVTFASNISMKDPRLAPMIFDPDILGAIHNFYKRQPYYRNQPMVQVNQFIGLHDSNDVDIQGKFHLDELHQISFMLLLNDITIDDTHMQYALESHKKVRVMAGVNRYGYPDKDIQDKFQIMDLVGKKGTLFVFDAGAGFHRAVYKSGTTRKIFHSNITPGYNIKDEQFDSWDTDELNGYADYVRNTINKINRNAFANAR